MMLNVSLHVRRKFRERRKGVWAPPCLPSLHEQLQVCPSLSPKSKNPRSYVTLWATVQVYCKQQGTDRFGDGRVIYLAGLGKLALSSSNSHGHSVLVTSAYSRKASCLSVRFPPPVSARLPLDGFPWNSILVTSMRICHEIRNLVTIGRNYRALYLKP
jgi:hypothetical protein